MVKINKKKSKISVKSLNLNFIIRPPVNSI